MEKSNNQSSGLNGGRLPQKSIDYFMNTQNWWGPLTFILIISVLGVGMIGFQTYYEAPPEASFISPKNETIIEKAAITRGQKVFHKYALMEYGSFFGDGAQRGPDFTAEALHLTAKYMAEYSAKQFLRKNQRKPSNEEFHVIQEYVKKDLKINRYNKSSNKIKLTDGQVYAISRIKTYYQDLYINKNTSRAFPTPGYIKSPQEIDDLAAFFFWGAWVCAVERPGSNFSYTHNWPYDPQAGNTPTSPVILWSVLGMLGFVLGCGVVLYFIGQYNQLPNKAFMPAK